MDRLRECLAALAVVVALVGVPALVYRQERLSRAGSRPADTRIFTLTGVARDGVWTADEVAGHNYWRRRYGRAHITVLEGDEVVLRLKSADVTHYFRSPKLGIDQVTVDPGHLTEVSFTAPSPGIYLYYCEAICGECHYFMRGVVQVLPRTADARAGLSSEPVSELALCLHDLAPPTEDDPVLRGEYLYSRLGCIACHEGPGVGTGINVPADHRYEGSKVKRKWLLDYMREPAPMRWRKDGLRPFIKMPHFELSDSEINDLAAYLLQRKDEELIPPTSIDWDSPATREQIQEGRLLYQQYQCQACHQVGGVGRQIGPAHDGVGSRLRPDYMYRWLLDPQKIVPGTPMPNKGLWEEEAEALVRFLQTLQATSPPGGEHISAGEGARRRKDP